MNSKLKVLVSVMAISFVMVGCGSSGSDGASAPIVDPMTQQDKIFIAHNITADVCEDGALENMMLNKGYVNILIRTEDNSVSCATYEREDDYFTCEEASYPETSNTACVIGFDIPNTQSDSRKNEALDTEIIYAVEASNG